MKISAQKAIRNYCRGTWSEQVEGCTITKCELYDHRPLTKKTRTILRENYLASLPPGERDIIEKRQGELGQKLANFRYSAQPIESITQE